LHASNNRLKILPDAIAQLMNLEPIYLLPQPDLRFPPADVAELGSAASIPYLRAACAGSGAVWESRVLFVGEGSAGKTWLYEALNSRVKGGNRKEDTGTVGVEIGPVALNHPERTDIRMQLACWDFSGQTVNHATHQFFFSRRSLFLLVWSARAGWEAGKLRRWRNNIRARAPARGAGSARGGPLGCASCGLPGKGTAP
jgi:internalin A